MSLQSGGIYEIGAGGMRLITTDEFEIGQRVYQANSGECTIVGKEPHGYVCVSDEGREHSGQTVGSASPYTRITKIDEPLASPERVEELKRKALEFKNQMAERARQAQKEASENKVKFIAELKKQYPWATPKRDKLSEHARAAKNLKMELQVTFPGHKFEVKSKSYSGGSSLTISWDFGPAKDEVEKITAKYSYKSFDGMDDSTHIDSSAYGNAVDEVLGRAAYVSESRDYGELFNTIRDDLQKRWDNQLNDFELNQKTHRLLSKTSFPVNFEYLGIGWNEGHCENVVLFSAPGAETGIAEILSSDISDAGTLNAPVFNESVIETNPTPIEVQYIDEIEIASDELSVETFANTKGITVVENNEKDGIELYFEEKPPQDLLNLVKGSGFRPAKREGKWLWWRKDTPETRAIVKKILES